MAARSRKKQNGVLPWIALLLLAVVVATFVYAHVHVVSQHGTAVHPHMPPPRARQLRRPDAGELTNYILGITLGHSDTSVLLVT